MQTFTFSTSSLCGKMFAHISAEVYTSAVVLSASKFKIVLLSCRRFFLSLSSFFVCCLSRAHNEGKFFKFITRTHIDAHEKSETRHIFVLESASMQVCALVTLESVKIFTKVVAGAYMCWCTSLPQA